MSDIFKLMLIKNFLKRAVSNLNLVMIKSEITIKI